MGEVGEGDLVRAIVGVREVCAGDTGVVIAGWKRANITVRWDKDGLLRRVHKSKIEVK
jgi:hypothetical protein